MIVRNDGRGNPAGIKDRADPTQEVPEKVDEHSSPMVILHQESLQANQDLEAGADGEETVKETSQLEVKISAMQSNKEDITNSHSFTDSREDINIDEECGRISGVHKHSNDDVWKVKEDDRTNWSLISHWCLVEPSRYQLRRRHLVRQSRTVKCLI